jgi:hypothetical protein
MGWLELMAWLKAMQKQRRGGEPDPDHWTEASHRNFAALRAERERVRGR